MTDGVLKNIALRKCLPFGLIAFLGLLLYLPSVLYKFTYFDDYTLIVQNAGFISNAHNVLKIFNSDVFRAETVAYRPFLILSFMIDAKIGGISPWIYHLSNMVIHLTVACLLFFFLKKSEAGAGLSLALAAFFLVHPALVPAVAWIPGRNDSLLGLAVLLWLISLYKITRSGVSSWLFIHLALYLSAIFIKEAALALPAVGLVYILLCHPGDLTKRARYSLIIGWAVILTFWLILRGSAIGGGNESGKMTFNSLGENVQGLLGYLGKMLLPFNLSVIPLPNNHMIIYGAVVIIIMIIAITARGLKDKGLFHTGASIMVMFLLPHLLRGAEFVNYLEHRLYVPLIGFILMASQMNVLGQLNWRKPANFMAISIFLGIFAAVSIIRLPIYYDYNSLLLNLIEKRPGLALSYQHMGYIFTESGEFNKAQLYYNKALELEPANKDIFHSLGVVYESQRQWQKAEQSFIRGLELAPRSSSLRYNLAYLYHQTGRAKEAERQYKLAIISRPENTKAQLNLGMLYHQQGRLQQAERQYRKVLDIEDTTPEAWYNLGIIFRQRGMVDSSRPYIERAVRLKPELKDVNRSF